MHLAKDTCLQWGAETRRQRIAFFSVSWECDSGDRFGATFFMSACDHECPASTDFGVTNTF